VDLNRDGELNGRLVTPQDFGTGPDAPTLEEATTIRPPVPVTLDTAEAAYKKVVAGAGCSLRRDSVDTRLIAELTSLGKRGSTIKDPDEMGGFGEIRGGPLPPGAEVDGIPTAWKKGRGLDPSDPGVGRKTPGPDGYTNLERYLNELAGDMPAAR
jgi:hypothetical protein